MQPTRDERLLAALSHASIAANVANMAGIIAALLIWATQRDRSRYVSAHALQSLVYQGIVLLIGTVLMLLWGICLALSLLPALLRPELFRTSPPTSFWLALIGLLIPLAFVAAATLYGFYGAFQVYRGRPFRYPLAGRLAPPDSALAAGAPATLPDVNPPAAAHAPARPPATLPDAPLPSPTPGAPLDAAAPKTPRAASPPRRPAMPPAIRYRRRRRPPGEEEN